MPRESGGSSEKELGIETKGDAQLPRGLELADAMFVIVDAAERDIKSAQEALDATAVDEKKEDERRPDFSKDRKKTLRSRLVGAFGIVSLAALSMTAAGCAEGKGFRREEVTPTPISLDKTNAQHPSRLESSMRASPESTPEELRVSSERFSYTSQYESLNGDIIVKEKGVKGEYPVFRFNAKRNIYESVNYPGTYPSGLTPEEFSGQLFQRYSTETVASSEWPKEFSVTFESTTEAQQHMDKLGIVRNGREFIFTNRDTNYLNNSSGLGGFETLSIPSNASVVRLEGKDNRLTLKLSLSSGESAELLLQGDGIRLIDVTSTDVSADIEKVTEKIQKSLRDARTEASDDNAKIFTGRVRARNGTTFSVDVLTTAEARTALDKNGVEHGGSTGLIFKNAPGGKLEWALPDGTVFNTSNGSIGFTPSYDTREFICIYEEDGHAFLKHKDGGSQSVFRVDGPGRMTLVESNDTGMLEQFKIKPDLTSAR